jgi:hypothetical protein
MAEAPAAVLGAQHARSGRPLQRGVDRGRVGPRGGGERRGLGAVVEHDERDEHTVGLGAEPVQARVEQVGQARRHADVAAAGRGGRAELLGVERVAGRGDDERVGGGGVERRAGRPLADLAHGVVVERAQAHDDRGAPVGQPAHEPVGRGAGRRRAQRGDDDQRRGARRAAEVVDEPQRRLVGRVQVLEHEHEAALARRLVEQVADRRQQPVALGGGDPLGVPGGGGEQRQRAA